MDASTMKTALGPSLHWYNEIDRYSSLFEFSANGSISRRFAVLILLLSLAVSAAMLLRKANPRDGERPHGPHRRHRVRLAAVPDVHAHQVDPPLRRVRRPGGRAGGDHRHRRRSPVDALAAQPDDLRRPDPLHRRNGVHGTNSYFYSSAWGIPWGTEQVTFGFRIASVLLAAALALLALALYFHLREPFTGTDPMPTNSSTTPRTIPCPPIERAGWDRPLVSEPLVFIVAAVVLFQVATAIAAGVRQSNSYSVPRSNLEALAGIECGMAEKIWTETDRHDSNCPRWTVPLAPARPSPDRPRRLEPTRLRRRRTASPQRRTDGDGHQCRPGIAGRPRRHRQRRPRRPGGQQWRHLRRLPRSTGDQRQPRSAPVLPRPARARRSWAAIPRTRRLRHGCARRGTRCPPDSVRTRSSRSPRPDGSSVPTSSSSIRRPASTPRRATAHSASPGPSPHRSRSATLVAQCAAQYRRAARRHHLRSGSSRATTTWPPTATSSSHRRGCRSCRPCSRWSASPTPCRSIGPRGWCSVSASVRPPLRRRGDPGLAHPARCGPRCRGVDVAERQRRRSPRLARGVPGAGDGRDVSEGRYRTGLGCARAVPPIRAEQYRARRAHHRHPRP